MDAIPAPLAAFLLELARQSIAGAYHDEPVRLPDRTDPALDERCGAFVTLKRHGALRGCIGRIESEWPLWETVARMARASAFEDPRFSPLVREELGEVTIEVSVMTPPEAVGSPQDVVVGEHGVIVSRGPRRALFLPQVAVEQGWDRDTLLSQLCLKAGLPAEAWREPDVELQVFRAHVFGE